MPTLLALPAIFLATSLAQAQTPPPDVIAQVDKVFEKWDRTDSPGCALGVYKGNSSDGVTVQALARVIR
jgi:hypothetical protein